MTARREQKSDAQDTSELAIPESLRANTSGGVQTATISDQVASPSHYKSPSGMEAIDVIEGFELNYRLGNAVKYILRAGKKGVGKRVLDLEKAIWYLKREVTHGRD